MESCEVDRLVESIGNVVLTFFSSTLARSSRSPSSIFFYLNTKRISHNFEKNVLEMSEIQKGGLFFAFFKERSTIVKVVCH
jgi:hypothetical protein